MRGPQHHRPGAIDRTARDLCARPLFHRLRFAGDHAFIDIRLATDHRPINGNPFARAGMDHIPGHDLVYWQVRHLPVPFDPGGFWGQPRQFANGLPGAPFGPRLEGAAQQDQHHDHRCGFVIYGAAARWQQSGGKGGQGGQAVGGHGSQRDKRVHIGRAAQQGRHPFAKEPLPRSGQNHGGQDELQHPTGLHADRIHHQRMQRRDQVPTHFDDKHRQGQPGRDPGQPGQCVGFAGFAATQIFIAVAADGCGISRSGAGGDQRGGRNLSGIKLQGCGFTGQIDLRRNHAGHGSQRPFDPGNTGCASHVMHPQLHLFQPGRIARILQNPGQGGGAGMAVCGNCRGFGGQIDLRPADPRRGLERPFDPADAGRTGHALNAQLDGLVGHDCVPFDRYLTHMGVPVTGRSSPCQFISGSP